MRLRQTLMAAGLWLGVALLAANALLTFQVLQNVSSTEDDSIDVAVDWEKQGQLAVDIADISLNSDRFADVPMGFLPIMTIWTEDENGDIDDIVDLPVALTNAQLQVWIDGGAVDVSSGYITIEGGYVSIEN